MQNGQFNAEHSRQRVEKVQKDNGISSARYGDAEPVALGQHVITRDYLRDPLD
jgi:hypothetical protein